MKSTPQPPDWTGLGLKTVCYAGLWLVLVEGDITSWRFGLPFVLGAAWWTPSDRAFRVRGWSPVGVAVFAVHFLGESIASGTDVAVRAFRPRMGLHPAFVRYGLRLSSKRARTLFVHAITLMPGTLSAQLEGDELVVHVLDRRAPYREDLERLELLTAYACGDTCLSRGPEAPD
jgi:multicomponent Na+:H+ antiporter subunit E